MRAWKACARCSDDEVFDTTVFEALYNSHRLKEVNSEPALVEISTWGSFGLLFCCLLWGIKRLIRGCGMTSKFFVAEPMQRCTCLWVLNVRVTTKVIAVVLGINVVQPLTIKETRVMPIRPPPMSFECSACGWTKTIEPLSDVLLEESPDVCPKCGDQHIVSKRVFLPVSVVNTLRSAIRKMLY